VIANCIHCDTSSFLLSILAYDQFSPTYIDAQFGLHFVGRLIGGIYSQEIHTTSVTLQGDIFQLSGLLTAGSRKYDSILFLSLQLLLQYAYISYSLTNRL